MEPVDAVARRRAARLVEDDRSVLRQRARAPALRRYLESAGSSRRCSPRCPARRGCSARCCSATAIGPRHRVHRRTTCAVRDARQPRRHLARVRPARAGGPAHARAAGPARAPGLPRPAHRARQPRAVRCAGGCSDRSAPDGRADRALPRPRRLQARSTTSCGHAPATQLLVAFADRIRACAAPERPRRRGSAATSSRSCSRTSTSAHGQQSPSASSSRSRSRSRSPTARCGSAPASASPRRRTARRPPPTS